MQEFAHKSVLKEFLRKTKAFRNTNDYQLRKLSYDRLRGLLQTELEKHQKSPYYKTFDWQIQ